MRKLLGAIVVAVAGAASVSAQTQDDFFNDSRLQDVYLTINTKDWEALRAHPEQNTYYPAELWWQGVTVRNVGIRSRGHVTRNGIKPGLRVDMNRYVSGQDFLGLKAFNLKNMYDDRSLLHETISMKLFARIGLAAPREAHARVYINNEFAGVYVIVEMLDRTFVSRVFGADEGSSDHGGYLYEYQDVGPYQFGYLGPNLEPYAERFEPKTRENDSAVALYGPIEEMIRAVNLTPDERFLSEAEKHLDLPEVMKFLAAEDYMTEIDGFVGNWTMNNFYLYRFQSNGISQLLPWDPSMTFSSIAHPINFNLTTNVLTIRAMAVPELRQIYLDTLMQCAAIAQEPGDDDPRGWLEREVMRQSAQIEEAVAVDLVFPFTLVDFHVEVESMRQFSRFRSSFVACEVSNASTPLEPTDCNALLDAAMTPAPSDTAATLRQQR